MRGRRRGGGAEARPFGRSPGYRAAERLTKPPAHETIYAGKLTLNDVHYTTKEPAPSDQFAALRNSAVDVQGATEPTATALQDQGLGVKMVSHRDVIPWFQDSYLGVNANFTKAHPDLVVGFLEAYLRGAADIMKSNGKLTPATVKLISHWTEVPEPMVRDLGATPYYGHRGAPSLASLRRVEKLYEDLNLIPAPVPVDKIVDASYLYKARAALNH